METRCAQAMTCAHIFLLLATSTFGRSIDETIRQASHHHHPPAVQHHHSPQQHISPDGRCEVIVELDIVYSCEEWNQLLADYKISAQSTGSTAADHLRTRRTAGIKTHRWTDRTMPYSYIGDFSSWARQRIETAIDDLRKYTCLTFTEVPEEDLIVPKVHFVRGDGCKSYVGMNSRWEMQKVWLDYNCMSHSTILHKILHALGKHHEQTRPDRDEYVNILLENIIEKEKYNFDKNSWNDIMQLGLPYDYTSIMHYGEREWTRNGEPTIRTVDPNYQKVIGNVKYLSFLDVKTLNKMYECRPTTCDLIDDMCPGEESFVGKDCLCWCPGAREGEPVRQCEQMQVLDRSHHRQKLESLKP